MEAGLSTMEHLSREQCARVAALYEARMISTLKVPAPQVQPPLSSFDLIELARFIVTGTFTEGGED